MGSTSKAQIVEGKGRFWSIVTFTTKEYYTEVQSDNKHVMYISTVKVSMFLEITTKALNLNKNMITQRRIYRIDDICSKCHYKLPYKDTFNKHLHLNIRYTITHLGVAKVARSLNIIKSYHIL